MTSSTATCVGGSSSLLTTDNPNEPHFWPPNSLRQALWPSGPLYRQFGTSGLWGLTSNSLWAAFPRIATASRPTSLSVPGQHRRTRLRELGCLK